MSVKAVIFDMDGVLIDSETQYNRLWQEFLKENGVLVTMQDLRFLAGSSRQKENEFLASVLSLPQDEIDRRKNAFYAIHPLDYKAIAMPGAGSLLAWLKEQNIRIALASSSPMDNISEVLEQCRWKDCFTYIVSGEMFKETKPHPEIYEHTIELLQIPKEEVIVIEDSEYGIEAAHRAGLFVTALIHPLFDFDTSLADAKIHRLTEVMDLVERKNRV